MTTTDHIIDDIKETYFFEQTDKGIAPGETPLARHSDGREDLIEKVSAHYQIEAATAKQSLFLAWQDVKL